MLRDRISRLLAVMTAPIVLVSIGVSATTTDFGPMTESVLEETHGETSRLNRSQLSGPYFGQFPPGLTPVRFAPDVFSTPLIYGCPVFTKDGLEAYWNDFGDFGNTDILMSAGMSGVWTPISDIPFASSLANSHFPCLSPDGQKLFFTSTVNPGFGPPDKENIWVSERSEGGWGTPSPLPATVNNHWMHWQISVAENGNIYYAMEDIWVSENVGGVYQTPQKLSSAINSDTLEFAPFIAPDESYLIFTRSPTDAIGNLYISFRDGDDNWTPAVYMEILNVYHLHDMLANVTRDGQYLFFISWRDGNYPYWVSADIIELYRPGCCNGLRGNANGDTAEDINISDITYLVDYLFGIPLGPAPECLEEGNANGDGNDDINISDITYLVDYLFGIPLGPAPPGCP